MSRTKFLPTVLSLSLSLSLLGLVPALSGCDSLKEKLGMEEAKKEKKDDDDKKKKDKDEEDEDEDKKEAKGDGSATPTASGSPSSPSGPLPAAGKSASHLPGDCDVAMTMNIAKILAHPSFSKNVVPAMEEALKKVSTSGNDAAKADAFLKDTGIGAKSFTDVAVCVKDTGGSDPEVSAAIAGDIKADSVVPAIEKADASVSSKIKDVDGRKAIVDTEITLGQLSDGSIALGTTEALFKALSATSDNAVSKYKLDTGKELAFSVSESLIQKSMSKGGSAPPELKTVKNVSGVLDLAAGKLSIRVGTGSADDAKKLESMFNLMKTQLGSQMAGAPPGTADALKNATTKIDGSDLWIESTFPANTVDSLATLLANAIKSGADEVKLPSGDGAATPPSDPKTASNPTPAKTAAAPTATTPAKTAATPPPPPPKTATAAKPPPPPKTRTPKK
ncbi:MAG: hypothetical protein JNK04_15690 [Myxococcales bacterium]|nr:hypothetical protein [Myxococcales bacterium]